MDGKSPELDEVSIDLPDLPIREQVAAANPQLFPGQVDKFFSIAEQGLRLPSFVEPVIGIYEISGRTKENHKFGFSASLGSAEEEGYDDEDFEREEGELETLLSISFNQSPDEDGKSILLSLDPNGKLSANTDLGDGIDLPHAVDTVAEYLPYIELAVEEEQKRRRRRMEQFEAAKNEQINLIAPQFSELRGFQGNPAELVDKIIREENTFSNKTPQQVIEDLELAPQYTQQIGENTFSHFSQAETVDGRPYILAYIEAGDKVYPVVYYRSVSSASWRWLPGIDPGGHHGKGYDEDAMSLPYPLQKSLSQILAKTGNKALSHSERHDFLSAFVPVVDKEDPSTDNPNSSNFKQKSLLGFSVDSQHEDELDDPGDAPNYAEKIDHWEFDSELYGRVLVDVFASGNGEINYGFMRTREGQVWLGFKDIGKAQLRRSGIRDEYAATIIDVSRSAYEHDSQTPTRGEQEQKGESPTTVDPVLNDRYVDAFAYGLSNVPLVQSYYQTIPHDEIRWGNAVPVEKPLNTYLFEFRHLLTKAHEANDTKFIDAVLVLTESMPPMSRDYRGTLADTTKDLLGRIESEQKRKRSGDTSLEDAKSAAPSVLPNMLNILKFEISEERSGQGGATERNFTSPYFPDIKLVTDVQDDLVVSYAVAPV